MRRRGLLAGARMAYCARVTAAVGTQRFGAGTASGFPADFVAMPLRAMADAALQVARDYGCEYAAFRCEQTETEHIRLKDALLSGRSTDLTLGISVRVLHQGTWGFAGAGGVGIDLAARLARAAVALARVSAPLSTERVELAAEPVHADLVWLSECRIDPFTVPDAEKVAWFAERSVRLLAVPVVDHVDASFMAVRECLFYADLAGTSTMQRRIRLSPDITVVGIGADGGFETMRTNAPPVGRGWEYLVAADPGWDHDGELGEVPELLAERLQAPSMEPGRYDLVLDPTNLWLTIHESVGHATELDRALGYEANYAGTSFATFDKLGSLKYGSELMHVTADRTARHGLATIAIDQEGVATQQWDLVRDGVLVGYQTDRAMAARQGLGRSAGCAYADSATHVPVQRMANVSLQPLDAGPSTADLIAGVEDGLYVVGDKSWSIDMQRYNFQFTGQRFHRIRNGRLVGQVKDAAYQATTTDFWGSLAALGGPDTYLLHGATNCGKAQPGQSASVSHGCPSAVFNGVRILNTVEEAGR